MKDWLIRVLQGKRANKIEKDMERFILRNWIVRANEICRASWWSGDPGHS